MTSDLRQLYADHSGFVSDKWEAYFPVYERWLALYRQQPIRLLEVGVQNGGSLAVWGQYFPFAEKIVGCDIDPACGQLEYSDTRIEVVVGDVNAVSTQQKIHALCNGFDIVIDDGSHKSRDIVATFKHFYPRLRPGGLYVVEDLHCSYWSRWQGGLLRRDSAIEFFKSLIDVLNLESWGVAGATSHVLGTGRKQRSHCIRIADVADMESVAFYNSMCVIAKGHAPNRIGGRVVVGQEAPVQASLPLHDSPMKVPEQRKNAKKLHIKNNNLHR